MISAWISTLWGEQVRGASRFSVIRSAEYYRQSSPMPPNPLAAKTSLVDDEAMQHIKRMHVRMERIWKNAWKLMDAGCGGRRHVCRDGRMKVHSSHSEMIIRCRYRHVRAEYKPVMWAVLDDRVCAGTT